MAMKTTHRVRHKKQAWSESNRESYKKLKWKNSSEEVRTKGCELGIQRFGRPNTTTPSASNLGPTSTAGVFRPLGKWANCTSEIIRSSPLMIQKTQKPISNGTSSIALTKSVLLPPINGSRMTPGEVACSITHATPSLPMKVEEPKAKLKTRLLSSHLNKENTLCHLYPSQRNEVILSKSNLIHSNLAVRKLDDSIKNLTSRAHTFGRSVSANEKLNAPLTAASSSVPLNRSSQRHEPVEGNARANGCSVTTCETDDATGSSEPKQMKESSCAASDIETESRCSEGKDGTEVIPEEPCSPEEEYYTHQRIVEWVLKVNASLFSPSSGSIGSISPGEEQDTAIKIVYEGD